MKTAVNEIIEEINQQMSIVEIDYANGVEISMSVFHQMLGQIKSKAIQLLDKERQQIIDAVNKFSLGTDEVVRIILKKYNLLNTGEAYYNDTYVSNGRDEYTTVNWGGVIQKIPKKGSGELEQINQDNPVTRGSTALVRVTSSQTEISDEEIHKQADYYSSQFDFAEDSSAYVDFIEGIKWYREQLKNK